MPKFFSVPNAIGAAVAAAAYKLVTEPMLAGNSKSVQTLGLAATILVGFPLGHHFAPK